MRYAGFLSLLLALPAAADAPFAVNGDQIRIFIKDGKTAVQIPVNNKRGEAVSAGLRLEWLSLEDRVAGEREVTLRLPPGESRPVVSFPLEGVHAEMAIWSRLRYRLSADGEQVGGTVSLARHAEHAFELTVSAARAIQPGGVAVVNLMALHPTTRKPVEGVGIRGVLDLDAEPIEAKGVTDATGNATLQFNVPPNIAGSDAELEVRGTLGDYTQEASAGLEVNRKLSSRIDTDKRLYQPGQTVYMRLLVLHSGGRAATNLPVRIRIDDPENNTAFAASAVTNRFGVAALNWPTPDNTRLGDYRIGIEHEGAGNGSLGSRQIKISRYDLPEFSVTVKTDRAYYVAGQDAVVEVSADYLFGKPVPNAEVRVVEESERHWDFREQRWMITEGAAVEAKADAAGKASVKLALSSIHRDLRGESWRQFRDATFTAYVRDPVSGKTEERRFDVRATIDPIHIWEVGVRRGRDQHVSTQYADGSPASCLILADGQVVGKTNEYGVGRVTSPEGTDSTDVVALDEKGLRGRAKQRAMWWSQENGGSVLETDKTLYRRGEPVRVLVKADKETTDLVLNVVCNGRVLASRLVGLQSGRGEIEIPWQQGFKNEVTIAVAMGENWESISRTVMFPTNTELEVGVAPAQPSYRPGEEAVARFAVKTASGRPTEAALGVAVVDAAVGERARTDEGLRNRRGVYWWGSGTEEVSGVTRRDLYGLDMSKPVPPGLDLLAEVMLANDRYRAVIERSADFLGDLGDEVRDSGTAQFKPVLAALNQEYTRGYSYPKDLDTLNRVLGEHGIRFETLLDPWEQPYRADFRTMGRMDHFAAVSAGPDKQFGTKDDAPGFSLGRPYFQQYSDRIVAAVRAQPAYPDSETEARKTIGDAGLRLEELRDPWGTPLRLSFELSKKESVIRFHSAGVDRRHGTGDDIEVERIAGSYFKAVEKKLTAAVLARKDFPSDQDEWDETLREAGLYPLRDAWGTEPYALFRSQSKFTELWRRYSMARHGEKPDVRTEIVPATEVLRRLILRSAGPDREAGTADDFELLSLDRVVKVETEKPAETRPAGRSRRDGTGAIVGRVYDSAGAFIISATITATQQSAAKNLNVGYEATATHEGIYLVADLPPGSYTVEFISPGFARGVLVDVEVLAGQDTVADMELQVGSVTESIIVEAATVAVDTSSAQISGEAGGSRSSTPRVREYFPETLLWSPLLETDARGRTQIRFRLADNITTWKLQAVASTESGEIGTAEAEIRAFQPFFIDHQPPRFLTVGDRIQLAPAVRNYLGQAQNVRLTLRPESWFDILSGGEQGMKLGPGEAANGMFTIRAKAPATAGKQRITATSPGAGDAIEKPVTVYPEGREMNEQLNVLALSVASLRLAIPQNALKGTARAELRVYPNLISHVIDGIEGIIRRPYGCAEQTISSSYPNLMLLKFLKRYGTDDEKLRLRATKNLAGGVARLAGYTGLGGGFNYWGRGEGDPVLTAYALTFLEGAKEFVSVPDEMIANAVKWMVQLQAEDGSFGTGRVHEESNSRWPVFTTASGALSLTQESSRKGVAAALGFLMKHAGRVDEPYGIAATALVAASIGEKDALESMKSHLRRLARHEDGMVYWETPSLTPYYGWGKAGRLETTALAVKALALARQSADEPMITSGVSYLLKSKDRYGVWHSTQATVRVLDAILEADIGSPSGRGGVAEVLAGGKVVTSLKLPAAGEPSGPLSVDVTPYLSVGTNEFTIRRAEGHGPAQVQLALSYYVPWSDPERGMQQRELRYHVTFDKTAARPGEAVKCNVVAARVASRGAGMMVAEIGLPPGADVDRRSLLEAMEASAWALNRFDVLPDKVIAYLWPRAGGVEFNFVFRPRLEMEAQSAPSLLYDYYNPDARLTLRPTRFAVKAGGGATSAAKH